MQLMQDARSALRLFRSSPRFTVAALVTVALGVGANTAIFSLVDAALLRPLPYPNPDRLVRVYETRRDRPDARISPSYANFLDWRELGHVFSHLATMKSDTAIIVDGPEPERFGVSRVTSNYFAVYGAPPILGRSFVADDERLGAAPVAIIGYRFWQERFGGDPGVLARTLRLSDETLAIVGVLPEWFSRTTSLWRPLQVGNEARARGIRMYPVYGRLQPGVTIEQAQRELGALAARLAATYAENAGWGVRLQSLHEATTGFARPTLRILVGAVTLVLLIACVNVASLLLARGTSRARELDIRVSLGASRARIVRQLLTESVLLSVAGGALGALVAWVTLDGLLAIVPLSLASVDVRIDSRVLAFGLGLSVLTGVLFGLAPALRLSRAHGASLGRASRGQAATLPKRIGQALVAAEVALAMVLLAGAGLMIRSLANMMAVDPGFGAGEILTVEVAPINGGVDAYRRYYLALLDRLRDLPGVAAAGAIDSLPLSGSRSMATVTIAGDGQRVAIDTREVLPGYFEAMRIPVLAGRTMAPTDRAGVAPVTVINEAAARQYFGGSSALGRHITMGDKIPREVVGIVGDVRHQDQTSPVVAEMYIPHLQARTHRAIDGQDEGQALTAVIRLHPGAGPSLAAAVREAAHSVGQAALVRRIRSGAEWLAASRTTPRQRTLLLGLLGGLGLLLAIVGVFGVTAYAVGRRTQEIAVRVALGARPADVVWAMVTSAAAPVLVGVAVGIAAAAATTRVVSRYLFEVTPTDPIAFAAAAACLTGFALLAAWLPARRAAQIDPLVALRAE